MYLLFKEKNILPSVSYDMGRGERMVASAFLQEIYEERAKQNEEIENMMK